MHVHLSGCIEGKIRYFIEQEASISEKIPASVVPLAQVDVMQTFLFGINVVPRREPKHLKQKWKIDGGRVLMAITNTLMMVQAGYPTGIRAVCSRENNH